MSRCVASELRLSLRALPKSGRRSLREVDDGGIENEEWMSPRLFFGVCTMAGLLSGCFSTDTRKGNKQRTKESREGQNLEEPPNQQDHDDVGSS